MNDNGSPTTDLIVLSPSDSSDTSIGGMGGTISDEIEMLLNHEHEIKKQHQHDEQQQEHSKNDEPTKLSGSCNPLKGSNQHYFMSDWYITELNNTQYFHSYTKLNDFLEGPALEIYDNDIDERNNKKLLTRAVCLFRNQIRFSNHFPHAYV